MRLFVGIWPSSGLEPRLRDLQAALHPRAMGPLPRLRFTSPSQWHLTLRFLGEVAEDRVEALSHHLVQTIAPIRTFHLGLAGPGCFPERGAPRVVWVGLDGELSHLSALHAAVSTATAAFAASPESQPFHPHLTLARVAEARPRDRDHLLDALHAAPASRDPTWDVTHVRLVRSELRPEGARYSVVTEIPLAGRNESPN